MGLLADFKNAAVARRRFPDDERLTPASLFALVRDMPYRPNPDPSPEATIEAWHATCWGKHYLLHTLFRDFGLQSTLIHAYYEVRPTEWRWLPEELLKEAQAAPVPNLHTFVRLQLDDEWMAVDATWPAAAGRFGLPVNERFEPGRDMKLVCDPDELFHAPLDADPVTFRNRILADFIGDQLERRDRFFDALGDWLARELYEPAAPH